MSGITHYTDPLTRRVLRIHSCCGLCQGLLPFYGQLVVNCVDGSQFVNFVSLDGPIDCSQFVAANGNSMNIH